MTNGKRNNIVSIRLRRTISKHLLFLARHLVLVMSSVSIINNVPHYAHNVDALGCKARSLVHYISGVRDLHAALHAALRQGQGALVRSPIPATACLIYLILPTIHNIIWQLICRGIMWFASDVQI